MGLRLNFGEPLAGAPVINLNRTETETHQQLELTISRDARPMAWYRSRNRMHFTDEPGGGDFLLHLGHITKNSLWNWLLRFNERREASPLSNLIRAAIQVSAEPAKGATVSLTELGSTPLPQAVHQPASR